MVSVDQQEASGHVLASQWYACTCMHANECVYMHACQRVDACIHVEACVGTSSSVRAEGVQGGWVRLTILSEMSVHHSQLQGELGRLKGVFPGLGSYVL